MNILQTTDTEGLGNKLSLRRANREDLLLGLELGWHGNLKDQVEGVDRVGEC